MTRFRKSTCVSLYDRDRRRAPGNIDHACSNGTKFGLWKFNAKTDRITAIGNFNEGLDSEILIVSDSGLAILGRKAWDASELTDVTTAGNGTRLGNGFLTRERIPSVG
jgi:hypothetical protein